VSLYLPKSAVAKENYLQLVRRMRLEATHKEAIKGIQEILKEKTNVIGPLMALGLTRKHAIELQNRLVWQNDRLEAQAKENAAREAKLKELQTKKDAEEALLNSPSDKV
jgi:hypothetical protein